jgi:hypothetical protein
MPQNSTWPDLDNKVLAPLAKRGLLANGLCDDKRRFNRKINHFIEKLF